jgi:hypothetical protein
MALAVSQLRGDHPAVVVQRLLQRAGYDYAAKLYPHPAWLWVKPASESVPADPAPALVSHLDGSPCDREKR